MKPKAWDESFDKEFFTEQEIAESDKRAEQITAELKRDKDWSATLEKRQV